MRYTFLGTSSGTPTRERNVSGAALRFASGAVWIFDCGEGTQHRILETDLRPGRIEAIFVTHLHGDHCYGLPGLIASIAVHGRTREDGPVYLIGPRGLQEWWSVTRRVSALGLSFAVECIEVDPAGGLLPMISGHRLQALPLHHRLPSLAFLIEEAERPGRFDADKANELGLDGPQRGALANGRSVTLADGRVVQPGDLFGQPRPGRRLAILGDTDSGVPIAEQCHEFDFVVHECTYADELQEKAKKWGHSTTGEVGKFAALAQPRQLWLNHFSSRYTMPDSEFGTDHLAAAVQACCPQTVVGAATDLLHVDIPFPETPVQTP